ncbi:MAG: hypothetical protein GEU26_08725 [Nitrososphaeraceae archaeon]|nr:hypothetical protein [Nitrososphaeraceae archaeon]
MNDNSNTFTFQIDGNTLTLNKLNKQMDKQFELMYRYYFFKQKFDIDLFKKSAVKFFDEFSEVKIHDRFFNNFTILWQILIQNGSFFSAEQIWQLAVQIATEWETLNQSKYRIHKGAAYYFWAVTCILKEDLEKGFLLMHQALEEDKKNRPNELTYAPAHAFVRLDYDQQEQYFRNKILEVTEFLEQRLKLYQSSRNGALSLDQLKSEFLDNKDLIDETFLFVYHLFHIKKLLSESKQGLTQNIYGSILMMQIIFTFILVIDNAIKKKYENKDPHKQDLVHLVEFLSKESNLIIDISKLREIGNRASNDLQSVLIDLLSLKPIFKSSKLEDIETDIGIVYALRNPAAHKIRDRPFIHQNFKQIVDRLFNVFFLAIEKLYIGTT